MNEQNAIMNDKISKHLKDEKVQRRVLESIFRAREDATVTIGRAAKLFGLSESQLRDWETKGLLSPRRSKENNGQRLFSLQDLDKLALFKELLDNGYSLSDIPATVDQVWYALHPSLDEQNVKHDGGAGEPRSIDTRVDYANTKDFWQFYIAQTLRIALSLLYEDLPNTIAGIVLPIMRQENATHEWPSDKIGELGPCLICWRDQDNTFHTFYEPTPVFAYASDFRVHGLEAQGEEGKPLQDRTFVVSQRRVRTLSLPFDTVQAVRQLLHPIYEDVAKWMPVFKDGPRDIVSSTTVLRGINKPDSLLTFLANRIIQLGGKDGQGKDRWKFCCVLLPKNPEAFVQVHSLVVQAQSEKSPHEVGETTVSPDGPILSLSLRAYQSGHVLFRAPISALDATIERRLEESPSNAAIAVPIGGEEGVPLGILYVVAEMEGAFGKEYQRVLRLMSRIIAQLLGVVATRKSAVERLQDIITHPRIVNRTLESYASENKFISDIEELLTFIQNTPVEKEKQGDPVIEGVTSFISIDLDNASRITSVYGDGIITYLSKVLGDRISDQIATQFDEATVTDYKLYHAYADRFYLFLKNKTLEQARENAVRLRRALKGKYYVPLLPSSTRQIRGRVELQNITVRLGVTSYKHNQLYTTLRRYPPETQIADMRSTMVNFLNLALNMGREAGGDKIVSWHHAEPPFEHGRLAIWEPDYNKAIPPASIQQQAIEEQK